VVFRSLTVEEIGVIVDLMLKRVREQLKAQSMSLEVTQAAKEHIIKLGYDVAYGARPLRRVIQNMIEDVLASTCCSAVRARHDDRGRQDQRDAGLDIHAAETKTPVEAGRKPRTDSHRSPAERGPDGALRALRLPGDVAPRPPLGGAVPLVRAWNTLVETRCVRGRARPRAPGRRAGGWRAGPAPRTEAIAPAPRAVGIGELDRSWAAGSSPGRWSCSAVSRGSASPTLLLQAAAASPGRRHLGRRPVRLGEESAGQIRLRAGRLGLLDDVAGAAIRVIAATDVGSITERARADRPALLVVDSVQTIASDELDGAPGSVGQVREVTLRLMELAKGEGLPVVLVGHVTKDGTLAGPKTLEHLVDVVLTLDGDRTGSLRLLRAAKNRFGSTEEVGVFEMGEAGARRGSPTRPARSSPSMTAGAGSVVAPTLEGSRPLLVEVQALVSSSGLPVTRRTHLRHRSRPPRAPRGGARRRAGIGLGIARRLREPRRRAGRGEPGLDLPLAIALASSLRDRPVEPGTVAIGEVGLLGELRPVAGVERRLREAARLGFDTAIVPRATRAASCRRSRSRLVPRLAARGDRHALGAPVDGIQGAGPSRRGPADPCAMMRAWAMLGSRSHPEPRRGARLLQRTRDSGVIRTIRILGAALGAFIGLVTATVGPSGEGLFSGVRQPGALVAAWTVSWLVLGFAILPYLTIVPATGLTQARPGHVDGRVRDGGHRPARRAARRPPARAPLSQIPVPLGDLAAHRRVALPRPRHGRPDGRQARRPAHRGGGDRSRARPQAEDPNGRHGEPRIVVDTIGDHRRRIAEIVESGFIYGTLVVPRFVLEELQHIADIVRHAAPQSRPARPRDPVTDAARRADTGRDRRRRGPRVAEVDAKLVELAKRARARS
jgi:DNA repair protein RadA/Sms